MTSERAQASGGRGALTLAFAVAASLVVVMAGTQIPTPLIPIYGATLNLGPDALSATYAAFLVALVPALLIVAIPSVQRHPQILILIALFTSALADIVLLTTNLPALVVGRALAGLALGITLGAASALALALVGERGRTLAATGTVAGALLGTVGTIALAGLLPDPLHLAYYVHFALALITLVLFVAALRGRVATTRVLAPHEPVGAPNDLVPRIVGFVLGALAFAVGAIIVAIGPLGILATVSGATFVVANIAAITMLIVANVSQFSMTRIPVRWAAVVSYGAVAVSLVLLAAGFMSGSLGTVLAGCAVGGVAQGLGYRTGLQIASAGLPPRRQGTRTSLYASIAYALCAAVVVVAGILVTHLGFPTGVWALSGVAVPIAVVFGVVAVWRRVSPAS
jgi:MFS family permease